jgi:hypothetical protein
VLALSTGLSASGILRTASFPPPLLLFMGSALGISVAAAFSPLGTRLMQGSSIAALVGFQAFRLPLELVLHRWHEEGVLPVQMTFSGHNFDIVTGALALGVLGVLLRDGEQAARAPGLARRAVWVFNVVGSLLLLAVGVIAVTSSPVPFRQYLNDPPVLLAYHVPYGLIVHVCVAGALFGHLLVYRWLARTARV